MHENTTTEQSLQYIFKRMRVTSEKSELPGLPQVTSKMKNI